MDYIRKKINLYIKVWVIFGTRRTQRGRRFQSNIVRKFEKLYKYKWCAQCPKEQFEITQVSHVHSGDGYYGRPLLPTPVQFFANKVR